MRVLLVCDAAIARKRRLGSSPDSGVTCSASRQATPSGPLIRRSWPPARGSRCSRFASGASPRLRVVPGPTVAQGCRARAPPALPTGGAAPWRIGPGWLGLEIGSNLGQQSFRAGAGIAADEVAPCAEPLHNTRIVQRLKADRALPDTGRTKDRHWFASEQSAHQRFDLASRGQCTAPASAAARPVQRPWASVTWNALLRA